MADKPDMMVCSPDDVAASFARNGYAVVHGIVPVNVISVVGTFLAAAEADALSMFRAARAIDAKADLCAEMAATLAGDHAALPKSIRDVAMGHHPLATRLDERLWAIARVPAVRSLLASLLGSEELFMHVPPASRFVLPGSTTASVPAHQDRSYNEHLPRFLTMWVPFVPIDDSCGGVVVYAGDGREARDIARSTGPWLGACSTAGLSPVQPHLQPGDVLLLSDWVVHGSAPNHSHATRRSIDYRFFTGGRSKKHALNLSTYVVIPPETDR
jgi:ectoine hydroxylase-related dioxygenase (phytanoyl-CoA dioxygenase family)